MIRTGVRKYEHTTPSLRELGCSSNERQLRVRDAIMVFKAWRFFKVPLPFGVKRRTFQETNQTQIWVNLNEVKIVCWVRRQT